MELLFDKWELALQSSSFVKGYKASDMVRDGFYPYYTKQNVKVMFIARESYSLSGSYIDLFIDVYRENLKLRNLTIDRARFHRLLLKLAYGINNHFIDWKKIPKASKLSKTFAMDGGISFAFANMSKFSNRTGHWSKDSQLMRSFIDTTADIQERNYFLEQIRIVDPDIILTGNLERLHLLGNIRKIDGSNKDIRYFELDTGLRKIPLMDMWHFSAPSKSDEKNYYLPLKQICQQYHLIS